MKNFFPTDLSKINLGCGGRKIPGWVNLDIQKEYCDLGLSVDLTKGIPFQDDSFLHAVSSHFVEHLSYETTLFCFLKEVHRVLKNGGNLWIITPDLKKVCESYVIDKCERLLLDRTKRNPRYKRKMENPKLYNKIIDGTTPSQHFVNDIFHQGGEHKNLLDIELLRWIAIKSGFKSVEETSDEILIKSFPEIKSRGDSLQALYAVLNK